MSQSPSQSRDATAAGGPSGRYGCGRGCFGGPGCCRLLRAERLWPLGRVLPQVQGGVLPLKHAGPVSGQTPQNASARMPQPGIRNEGSGATQNVQRQCTKRCPRLTYASMRDTMGCRRVRYTSRAEHSNVMISTGKHIAKTRSLLNPECG